ncbi:MAG: MFS transporter [Pseudomonadota bacterium]|nr:MFS transporter [Pseudomonadota bacterium]
MANDPNRRLTAAYYTAFATQGLSGAALGPTLPALAALTQTSLSGIAILFTVRALGTIFGSFYGGRLYDRLPGNPLTAAALLAMAALLALVPLTGQLWLLAAVIAYLGAAMGVMNLGCNTLLVWLHRERVGPYMSGLHFCFGIGAFCSPLIIAQVLVWTGSIIAAYWVLAAMVVPVALWLWRLPSPAAPRASTGDTPDEPIDYRLVQLIVVFFFVYVGSEVTFGSWLYTYAVTLHLADEVSGAYLVSAFGGALTLGRLASIPMASRFRPRNILLADLLGGLAGMALILLWPASAAALWAGTVVVGGALASVFPTMLSFVQRRMPVTGRVTGWFMIAGGVGAMLFPWLAGHLIEWIGPAAIMAMIAAGLGLALVVLAVLRVFWHQPTRKVYEELKEPA